MEILVDNVYYQMRETRSSYTILVYSLPIKN